MPIYLEPGRTYPVVLKSDKGKTPEPTFWAKSLSMRMQENVSRVLDKWLEPEVDAEELFSESIDTLLLYITKTENMPGFQLEKEWILDHLTYQEVREVLSSILFNNHLDHTAKKD